MSKKNKTNVTGQIRIIGGQWRGRKLPVLDKDGLRPTTDRVKETLFNWLAPDMVNARCLDCFAGSGSLGFEALSRHASEVVLIEQNRQVAQQLSANAALLNTTQATIVNDDTLIWLNRVGSAFDIVFVDPPFRKDILNHTIALLEQRGWLSNDAMIYIECEVEHQHLNVPINWHLYREKVAGQVAYRLYHRQLEFLEE